MSSKTQAVSCDYELMTNRDSITVSNSVNSRLLSLPPELRFLVFRHVCSPWHFHVRHDERDKGRLMHYLLPPDEKPPSPSTDHFKVQLWGEKLMARDEGPDRLRPLWRTCRQMYTETRHLPFTLNNTFSFGDRHVMSHFVLSDPLQPLTQNISTVWLTANGESAMALALARNGIVYRDEYGIETIVRPMACLRKIIIASRCNRLEKAASIPHRGSFFEHLRAGWELEAETNLVDELTCAWVNHDCEVEIIEV